MQIGGLGGSHSTSDHHVTNCIHDHHETQDKTGMMAMKTSASMEAYAAKSELQQDGLFSLSAWMKNMLGSGKGFLLNFWEGGQASAGSAEGNQTVISNAAGSQAATSQTAAVQAGNLNMAVNAAVTVQPAVQPQVIHSGSHFSSAEDAGNRKRKLWQKIRARFQNMSGQLDRRRSQKYFDVQAKNSFRARPEKSEENLRKHNRCHRDTVEIKCIRTEESYLMDSYDRKGEYATLTTKKL